MTFFINGDVIDPDDPNAPVNVRAAVVLQRITSIEREQLMPRATRETIIAMAEERATALGLTNAQLRAKNRVYAGVKALDEQIALLRAEYTALTTP